MGKRKSRILIVDDDSDIALTFRLALEESGLDADVFYDPQEAISNFTAKKYDLLLIDIKLPTMNGFELYDRLLEIDKGIRVCFITAYDVHYKALQEIFVSQELDGTFVKKPIEIERLIGHIQTELNR